MSQLLETVEFEPKVPAEASVIWLHGLGADGHDFAPIVPEMQFSQDPAVRFVFPHAPTRPVTINNGYVMRAWYDITELSAKGRQDEAGIVDSEKAVRALIEREKERGIPSDKIFLAGFSQGGAMSLFTGLRYPEPLAGIVVLSAYLPLAEKVLQERAEANHNTPIFMAHGVYDMVVPLSFGAGSKKLLEEICQPVTWHQYPIDHSVCPPEIVELRAWIHRCLRG